MAVTHPMDEALVAKMQRMFRRHCWLIAACTVACLLLAGCYLLVKAPQFEAVAQIEVRPAGSGSLGLDEMAAKLFSPAEANTELQSAVQVLRRQHHRAGSNAAVAHGSARRLCGPLETGRADGGGVVAAGCPRRLLQRFRKGLGISVVPKTDIVTVRFRSRNAELSAAVVSAMEIRDVTREEDTHQL